MISSRLPLRLILLATGAATWNPLGKRLCHRISPQSLMDCTSHLAPDLLGRSVSRVVPDGVDITGREDTPALEEPKAALCAIAEREDVLRLHHIPLPSQDVLPRHHLAVPLGW